MINKDVFVRTVHEVMQAKGYKVTLDHAEQAGHHATRSDRVALVRSVQGVSP